MEMSVQWGGKEEKVPQNEEMAMGVAFLFSALVVAAVVMFLGRFQGPEAWSALAGTILIGIVVITVLSVLTYRFTR